MALNKEFIPTNLESIIFDEPTNHEISIGMGLVEILLKKWEWKRGKQALIEAGFSKQHWREGGNWKMKGMQILLGIASIFQCFSHAKGNIQ